MLLELMISTIPTAFSKTRPSFLQLSGERPNKPSLEKLLEGAYNYSSVSRQLTYDDGVNFAFDLQGGVVAAKDVHHLFQLCLLNHQVVFLLKVFLQQTRQGIRMRTWWITVKRVNINNLSFAYHPPLFSLQLQQRESFLGCCFGSVLMLGIFGFNRWCLRTKVGVLMSLLLIWDVLQT